MVCSLLDMFNIRFLLVCLILSANALSFAAAHSDSTGKSLSGFDTLEALYKGNERFKGVGSRKREAVSRLVEESTPSFMFLGCTDNRLTPASIFQSPIGSIISQNNIGNQYSKTDVSTDAAITYAIQELGVQHIIVLGHYGCPGVSKAITAPREDNPVMKWISPIVRLYKTTRRREIVKFRDSRMPHRGLPDGNKSAPSADEAGFRSLVEENVKRTVKALKEESILAKEYQRGAKTTPKESVEVYVHGFVFDEATGNVVNLNVSFGPPGFPIPSVPFGAVAAAKNFHREKHFPGFNKGKNL
ncbi:carbonic anhydrase [Coprinopsis marcescibilis]|uniref:Carbonic anhydrase n=1 Tax=Coprinopsis marcescibilis TaxID=230819 RepID=A0A5C3KTD4_COPMA|nr:carbonic anhydrase [Coprinopsis marcescibilis]